MIYAEDIISEKGPELICVSPDVTVFEALKIMTDRKIGAILVKEGEDCVGIWTERDLMRNTLMDGFDPKTARIGDHMTTSLVSAPYTDHVYSLADKILGLRMRHLLIEREGKYIGLLSAGDIIRASLQLRTEQLKELDHIVNLDYYSQWKWEKKRKK
jgi:CBS domain-containing protein